MKKIILPIIILLCLFLTACEGGEKHVSGLVDDTVFDESGSLASFTVITGGGDKCTVSVAEHTHFYGFDDHIMAEEFKNGERTDVGVMVVGTAGDGGECTASTVGITEYRTDEIYVFHDGAEAEIWAGSGETIYRMADGTALIRISEPMGPADVYVGGAASFDDFSAEAQAKVLAFYEEQGLLYEEREEILKAYAEYLEVTGAGEEYSCRYISQDIAPSASNERIIAFETSAMLPHGGDSVYEYSIGAVFDRETGDVIDNTELFTCPPEELAEKLFSEEYLPHSDMEDMAAKLRVGFDPKSIVLLPDRLHIDFNPGSLSNTEVTFILAYDYEDDLKGLIHDWAIPE